MTIKAPDNPASTSAAGPFAYDVFVVHADAATDEAFVNGYLLANLGLAPERVLRLQTLELGQFITKEIERSVRSSRVTVVVLSASFTPFAAIANAPITQTSKGRPPVPASIWVEVASGQVRGWLSEDKAHEIGISEDIQSLIASSGAALVAQIAEADGQRYRWQQQLARNHVLQGHARLMSGHAAHAIPYLIAARESGAEGVSLRTLFRWATYGLPLMQFVHQGSITAVAWSPEWKRLATASSDRTARVWDAGSGQAVTPPVSGDHLVRGTRSALFGSPRLASDAGALAGPLIDLRAGAFARPGAFPYDVG